MTRFSSVKYDRNTKLVEVSAGCLFDELYSQLSTHGRTIVGGATHEGVGVTGWLLGGGYSLLSNQYGLGIDNVVEFEVIVPGGDILTVNMKDKPELFQALRVCLIVFTTCAVG